MFLNGQIQSQLRYGVITYLQQTQTNKAALLFSVYLLMFKHLLEPYAADMCLKHDQIVKGLCLTYVNFM